MNNDSLWFLGMGLCPETGLKAFAAWCVRVRIPPICPWPAWGGGCLPGERLPGALGSVCIKEVLRLPGELGARLGNGPGIGADRR